MVEVQTNLPIEKPVPQEAITAAKPVIEVIKDYIETQSEGDPVIVVNRAAGHEPSILGVAVAQEVNKIRAEHGLQKARIVVPVVNGREAKILLEENPTDADLIELDNQYASILEKVIESQGNFSEHLAELRTHYDDVEALIKQRFGVTADNFQTHSLTTGEPVTHSPRNIIGSIDAGSRFVVDAPRRYFMFPVLLSELAREAQKQGLSFSESDMLAVAERMYKTEALYDKVFIPKVNTLSANYLSGDSSKAMEQMYDEELGSQPESIEGRSRIYTPAMKRELQHTPSADVTEQGVYAMFSGTGRATEQTRALIAAAKEAGLVVYTNPWAANVEGVSKVSPQALSDPHIEAIFGRSGWGTGWQAQNLALPWFVIPYEQGDDPEIYFNNQVVQRLRMGKVIDPSKLSARELTDDITETSPGLRILNRKVTQEFGSTDGIRFMAEEIAKDYLGKK